MAKDETKQEVIIGIPKELKLSKEQRADLEKRFENQLVEVMETGKGDPKTMAKARQRVKVKQRFWKPSV